MATSMGWAEVFQRGRELAEGCSVSTPREAALPEWARETPEPHDDYQLAFYQATRGIQIMQLSREESSST